MTLSGKSKQLHGLLELYGKSHVRHHVLGATLASAILAAGAIPALAQSPSIGAAARVQNSVSGIVGGRSQTLLDGSAVFANELVKTEADALAKLTFLDQTNLSVGPSSQVKLDKFVFDPNKSASAVAVSMSTGAFRFVTGNSDPAKFKLTTPAAAIGLRGTILDINNTLASSLPVGWWTIVLPPPAFRWGSTPNSWTG